MGPSSTTILQSKSLHPSLSWEVVSTPLSRLPPSTLSSPHPSLSGKPIACCPAHLSRAGGDEEEKMKVFVFFALYSSWRPQDMYKKIRAVFLMLPFNTVRIYSETHTVIYKERRRDWEKRERLPIIPIKLMPG